VTRRKFEVEEKFRIALEGLKGEASIGEVCPREGINLNLNCRWSKDFPEAGKTARQKIVSKPLKAPKAKSLEAKAYKHNTKETIIWPDIGAQATFKKKKEPVK